MSAYVRQGRQVLFAVETYRHRIEVHAFIEEVTIQGTASTRGICGSIAQVFGMGSRQIQKCKGKFSARRQGAPRPGHASRKDEQQRRARDLKTIRPALEVLTISGAGELPKEAPTVLIVFLSPSARHVQVLRRLKRGDVHLLDPQPARILGS